MLFPLMWGNYLEHFIRKWGKEGAEVINAFYLLYIPPLLLFYPAAGHIRRLGAMCILYCT